MNKSFFINSNNLKKFREKFRPEIAIIARPDRFLSKNRFEHLIVETKFGILNRCFLATYRRIQFLIIYGRFDKIRTTSADINFEITQEVISMLNIKKIVGTFAVGSIKENDKAGSVYIPHDFVGMGQYNKSRNKSTGFKNVDMFRPFCAEMRGILKNNAENVDFPVNSEGIYVCFHGYPRIETEAELNFYRNNDWDIVGQTLDPEATLAREAGCHYAAIAATIDDRELRNKFFSNDPSARKNIDNNITEGRRKTFELFLASIVELVEFKTAENCNCARQKKRLSGRNKNFYYLPTFF